jgi:hypothetical protein
MPRRPATAARELRGLGVAREQVSIVARSHDEEGALARASGASPDLKSRTLPVPRGWASWAGICSPRLRIVMPGIGPIVADGPLAAGLGEVAGHLVGGIARTLHAAGCPRTRPTRGS